MTNDPKADLLAKIAEINALPADHDPGAKALAALALTLRHAMPHRDICVLVVDRGRLRKASDDERFVSADGLLSSLQRDVFPDLLFGMVRKVDIGRQPGPGEVN